ncbi:hypothetical protein WJX84_010658 [Apatococcus fuscideae]|uniref:Protein N-terminal glutamine amidohydrolase n=1 Tax=Apatococcus fuscideae TaxID=2026836 RepID=A0AAW1S971_9CHLO
MHAQETESCALRQSHFQYTAWYCEENIYQLLAKLTKDHARAASQLFAVFVSNPQRQLPLWSQKAGNIDNMGFICYDYHVIAIELFPDQETLVYDFDSILPFPSKWRSYVHATLLPLPQTSAGQYSRWFRKINAATFLSSFASDRSHMRESDGSWKAPPPVHPCIVAEDGTTMNLEGLINMTHSSSEEALASSGQVLDEERFYRFCCHSQ